MKAEPVSLVVARATVAGEPKIDLLPTTEVRVKVGQAVHVKFAYKLAENSKDREEWQFSLESNLGPTKPKPVQAKWGDRWGIGDDLWGALFHEYVVQKPGRYSGTFSVRADYAQMKWGGGGNRANSHRAENGTFTLVVEP